MDGDKLEMAEVVVAGDAGGAEALGEAISLIVPEGHLKVTVQGDTKRPAVITYHALGLDHVSCFQTFLNHPSASALKKAMCFIHIDAPGQEQNAKPLPDDYQYPTLDQLATHIDLVLKHFSIKSYVGLGAGIGANILLRHALANPLKVDGLCLIGPNAGKPGWTDYGYLKTTAWQLRSQGMTVGIQDMFLQYWFPQTTIEDPTQGDLMAAFKGRLTSLQPKNLAQFVDVALSRSDLLGQVKGAEKFDSLLVAGHDAYHLEETEALNEKLPSARTSYLKIFGMGDLGHEQEPAKVLHAFMLFLQGLGLDPSVTIALNEATMRPPRG